ncbi:upstream activation factor subunit UAF30-like [Primulina eburnea]|uniref:upstream activation factor subunit UAF30-like n=1 Tax=Primulina eburnea TaxID=1245227 RepID=UPI003C6C8C42
MAPTSGLFRGCRALYSAAKSAAAPSPKPNISASSNKPAAAAAGTKDKKSSPTGLLKAKPVSPTLRNFVGASEISRAEALKKVWGYIKLHNLQNPSNKKEIFCDGKLKALFNGKEKVGFLEITKLLSPHFVNN